MVLTWNVEAQRLSLSLQHPWMQSHILGLEPQRRWGPLSPLPGRAVLASPTLHPLARALFTDTQIDLLSNCLLSVFGSPKGHPGSRVQRQACHFASQAALFQVPFLSKGHHDLASYTKPETWKSSFILILRYPLSPYSIITKAGKFYLIHFSPTHLFLSVHCHHPNSSYINFLKIMWATSIVP